MNNLIDSEENKFLAKLGITAAIISLTAGTILSFIPANEPFNTLADEAKITELAKERCALNQQRSYSFHRDDVIDEIYSRKTVQGFNRLGTKICLTLGGAAGLAALFFSFCGVWSDWSIKGYFKARADYWNNRSKKEGKVLDELIELQRKISNIEE